MLGAAASAGAQAAAPGFIPSVVQPSDLYGIPVGRWYVELNRTRADTFIDGTVTTDGVAAMAPTGTQLNASSITSEAVRSKQASAAASITASTLGAYAAAVDRLYPDSTRTASTSYAQMVYWAVLPSCESITFNLALDGSLNECGHEI